MKRIALLTSGGDAPGMNACIRSVVRCAVYHGIEVYGVMRGYQGLIEDEFIKMEARSVSNIIGKGGTILKTARSAEFMTKSGRKKAYGNLLKYGIDTLVVIGGNGSFKGAMAFYKDFGFKIIGIPGTIDNDCGGTDYTIGFHTALNTALEAIDKVRDTVTSMERIYVVEVMGRNEAALAIGSGLAGGAEDIMYPGMGHGIDKVCRDIKKARDKGKISCIIIVSEGVGHAQDVAKKIHEKTGFESRPIVLGHIQRGGVPASFDRMLASRMGCAAIEGVLRGEKNKMVGIRSHRMVLEPMEVSAKYDASKKIFEKKIYDLAKILAT